jgi:hypothetical protein
MGTDVVLETSFLYRHLTRLIAREDFVVNDELKGVWKEVFVACFKVLFQLLRK